MLLNNRITIVCNKEEKKISILCFTVKFFEGNATMGANNSALKKSTDHRIIASKIERKNENDQ